MLATGYLLMFPDVIVGGNLASYALLLTLLAALSLRVVVYVFAERPPFSERVIFGGGRFAGEVARQIETRPDLALRVVGLPREPPAARARARDVAGGADRGGARPGGDRGRHQLESRRPAFFIQDRWPAGPAVPSGEVPYDARGRPGR